MPAMTCEHDHTLHTVGGSHPTWTSSDGDDVRTKTTHRTRYGSNLARASDNSDDVVTLTTHRTRYNSIRGR